MPDIFLSYSREDQATARRFAAAFEARGLSVWWDTVLRTGEAYDEVTENALRTAKAVVVLWSRVSVASRWVRAEATLADRNATLMPVMIEACERPIMFELTQTAELSHWRGNAADPAWLALLADVQRFIDAAPAAPVPAATTAPAALSSGRTSIVVLPFANVGGDEAQEYFSDGVTEDIINDLGKVSALSVVSRHTAFTFKGRQVDLRQVARELGVTHVLEGSVRKAGNRVRVSAQLIEGATDAQVWSERFDRDVADIFALQDELSEAIVEALKLKLLPAEKQAIEQRGTSDPHAYELFLMARRYYVAGSERHEDLIVRLCRKAVEIDPGYARAWALLAQIQTRLHHRGLSDDDGSAAAERAFALAPRLAEVHAALGDVARSRGRIAEAVAAAERALDLGPQSYEANRAAGFAYSRARRFGDAIRCLEAAAAQMDNDYNAAAQVIQCYQGLGDEDGARTAGRRALARIENLVAAEPEHGSAMGHGAGILALLGETQRAKEWIARATLLDPTNLNLQENLVCALVIIGDHDAALDQLERVLRTPTQPMIAWARNDNDLDPLRDHPRFATMLGRAAAACEPRGVVTAVSELR